MGDTKRCSKCHQEKPLWAFNKSPISGDGLSYWCRDCKRADVKSRQERRKKEGLCPYCGERPPDPGYKTCTVCRAKMEKNTEKYWQGRLGNG